MQTFHRDYRQLEVYSIQRLNAEHQLTSPRFLSARVNGASNYRLTNALFLLRRPAATCAKISYLQPQTPCHIASLEWIRQWLGGVWCHFPFPWTARSSAQHFPLRPTRTRCGSAPNKHNIELISVANKQWT